MLVDFHICISVPLSIIFTEVFIKSFPRNHHFIPSTWFSFWEEITIWNENWLWKSRTNDSEVPCKKMFLKISQNSYENQFKGNQCWSLFFNKFAGWACNFIQKETLAQMFSCKLRKIFKDKFFIKQLQCCLWKNVAETPDEHSV